MTPPTAAGAPPKDVQTAFQLYIANIVLGLIGAILTYLLVDALIAAQLKASGATLSNLPPAVQTQIAGARAATIVGIVIGVALLALYAFFVFQMRAGKNWARIVLTVLSAITVVVSLIGFASYGAAIALGALGIISVVISVLQLILIIAAVVFMFRPGANAYFTVPR